MTGRLLGTSEQRNSPQSHAFLYTDNALYDLNDLLEGGRGWELLDAAGVLNAAGQIVGTGLWNGSQHAFRLDPVLDSAAYKDTYSSTEPIQNPEPATWLLFASGACLSFKWKKRT